MGDDLAQVKRLEHVRRSARPIEIPQPAHNVGAVAARRVNDAQIFERRCFIGARGRVRQQHLAVADDGHEGVAEIVDHAAGHFAEGAQPLLLHGVPLCGVQICERGFELASSLAHAFLQ